MSVTQMNHGTSTLEVSKVQIERILAHFITIHCESSVVEMRVAKALSAALVSVIPSCSADRVFSQFAYKLKKSMNMESGGATTMRRNQQLVAGIILLKEALALIPSLAEVRAQMSGQSTGVEAAGI